MNLGSTRSTHARQTRSTRLDFAFDVRANSRLSCQIVVTEELDGLVVRTPSYQGR